MTKLLLSIHVLVAIVCIGPVTVAASLFPRYARRPGSSDRAIAGALHRITRVYGVLGGLVPLFGFATAISLGVLTNGWLLIAISLTAVAGALLIVVVLPTQRELLATPVADESPAGAADSGTAAALARVAMATGMFNVLWATVVVLMVVRPGSTTGA